MRLRRCVLDLTHSMLVAGYGRDGFGQLGEAAARHGLEAPSWEPLHRHAVDDSKSFFVLDREACILCGRCTTACDDVQRIGAISLAGRGHAERAQPARTFSPHEAPPGSPAPGSRAPTRASTAPSLTE